MDSIIRPLQAGDRPAAACMLDDTVGVGFWRFEDGTDAVSFVAVTGKGVAGVVITCLEPADDADALAALGPAPTLVAPGDRVLHVRAIAVEPAARRTDLARRLLASAEAEAVTRGARAAYLFAWLPAGRPEPAAVPFYLAAGYIPGRDIADFYAAASLAAWAQCPYCGAPPCRCAARPFTKALGAA